MSEFKTIHKNVAKKSDARKLVSWWNANTEWYHFAKKIGRWYNIVRQMQHFQAGNV